MNNHYLGIDIGSVSIAIVLIDKENLLPRFCHPGVKDVEFAIPISKILLKGIFISKKGLPPGVFVSTTLNSPAYIRMA